ncbi:hypothetical protein ScPMuIL_003299 [Solemya velum]
MDSEVLPFSEDNASTWPESGAPLFPKTEKEDEDEVSTSEAKSVSSVLAEDPVIESGSLTSPVIPRTLPLEELNAQAEAVVEQALGITPLTTAEEDMWHSAEEDVDVVSLDSKNSVTSVSGEECSSGYVDNSSVTESDDHESMQAVLSPFHNEPTSQNLSADFRSYMGHLSHLSHTALESEPSTTLWQQNMMGICSSDEEKDFSQWNLIPRHRRKFRRQSPDSNHSLPRRRSVGIYREIRETA